MSRWLQQQVQPQYSEVEILEVLEADLGYYQVNQTRCMDWMATNSLTHPVLRDKGQSASIASALSMNVKEMLIVDSLLKIAFKGRVTDAFAMTRVLDTLDQLQ